MSMVRFATVCDGCGKRGPEYDSGFTMACRECGMDACKGCRVSGSEREPDAGFSGDCVCLKCKDIELEEERDAPGVVSETLREAW